MLSIPGVSSTIAIPARMTDGAPVASPSYTYPWVQSGLVRFELQGSTAADARLVQLPSLITHTNTFNAPFYDYNDPATNSGRSILFGTGSSVYVGNGQFWTLDATGAKSGPY